jgi:hypothetical protein
MLHTKCWIQYWLRLLKLLFQSSKEGITNVVLLWFVHFSKRDGAYNFILLYN